MLPGADSDLFPGAEVEVVRPEKLDGVAVVDAQRIWSVVVVDSVSVVEESAVRFLFLANVILPGGRE